MSTASIHTGENKFNISTQGQFLGKFSSLVVLTDRQALESLSAPGFASEWDTLSQKCPWGSVFQGRTFVSTWYRLYQKHFQPIVVKAEFEGRLVGLLTMAKDIAPKAIQVAGGREAHYQVWLAEPECGEAFIKQAITALRSQFKGFDINFYNTPPLTPLSWATEDAEWRSYCTVRSLKRPLMDLKAPYIQSISNSKRFRKRLNQLRRLNKVEFEHVTSLSRYAEVLNTLADQFDFRKAAKYNWPVFRQDPIKKPFLLELFRERILHVTLLTLNGEIIASITDTIGYNKWVHGTEMTTHSCLYAKYSPGTLSFLLLGQQLAEKGYSVYDLTPGNDPYKEKLANAHDYVHELYISSSVKTYIRNKVVEPIRLMTRNSLEYSGLAPKQVKEKLVQLQYYIRSAKPASLLPKMLQSISAPIASAPILILVPPLKTTLYSSIKRYSLSDLLDYDPQSSSINKWDFLSGAMRRLEAGELPYTISKNGNLLYCCWLSQKLPPAVHPNSPLPNGALILHEFYTHPDEDYKLPDFIRNVAQHIVEEGGCNEIYAFSEKAFVYRQLQD